MLKLYTNTDFLVEKHRREVFPLLFDLVFMKNENIQASYTLVDLIADADVVIFPIAYTSFLKSKTTFLELNAKAKHYKKPIWIYTAGDYGFTNFIQNSYTFRLGGFNSKLSEHTCVMPSFINDPYASYLSNTNGFKLLKKEEKPSVGFVGHAQSGMFKFLKEYSNYLKIELKRRLRINLIDKQPFYPSSVKRAKYLHQLHINDAVHTNFILRNKYQAGAHSKLSKAATSKEFYNNIYNNAYTFCLRGVGNFSVRFYETLAVGRIPIVINTDCKFPLADIIDWTKHCLIIEEHSKKPITQHIIEFHNSLSNSEFEDMQQSNRALWLNTLQRDAYFLEIYKHFKPKLK